VTRESNKKKQVNKEKNAKKNREQYHEVKNAAAANCQKRQSRVSKNQEKVVKTRKG